METLKSCPFEEPIGEYEIENDKPMMTNEEWIKQCNTEQLVDAIFECTMANSWNFSKNGIKRWLKQPHTPNSIFVRSGKW